MFEHALSLVRYLMDRILTVTRPKVFQIEFNVRFPPPVHFNIDFPNSYTFRGDHYCRKFGSSLSFLDKIVAKKHGYVGIYGEVNDVWFIDRKYLHVFGRPPATTAQLYCANTLATDEAWIDDFSFFFGEPNKDRAALASVLGDAKRAVEQITAWMETIPDDARCSSGPHWAFGVTVPDTAAADVAAAAAASGGGVCDGPGRGREG